MGDINDLRRARKAAADDMQARADALTALEDQEGAEETALAAAQAAFDTARAAFEKADRQVKRAEEVEASRAAAAQPEPGAEANGGQGATAPAQPKEKGLQFGAMLRTLAAAGGNLHTARMIAEENGQSGLFAVGQNLSSGEAGGFLVPEDVSSEVIELLRPASVVTAMGPRIVPLPNGNLTQNRRASGASFGYGDETSDAPVTGYSYGQMKLSAKKMRGIVPISNDLMRAASTSVDRMVRDDAIADAAQIQDRYFLRGAGTEFAPKGLRYQLVGTPAAATNILVMTAGSDLQKVTSDLGRMELALANANVPYNGAHWIMSPRTAMYLTNLRDGNGNLAFPEMQSGQLRRKPVHVTTEIPSNLGGGGDASEIMLVHPMHVVIGEHMGITIAMSDQAAYRDSNGELQSAFSRDETLMRMILQHDLGLRHLPAVAVLTGVTWAD
ncbi:phage major capsid protein, HK97 family [Salipiger thiooxidans]|uniref:Phage major capsid protein, HK97 family n=1 Tax=Salipiger thiooxidans TaxID=282683 RepID=A0A1G7N5F5_9RHOB|nr:phage major capsid protein [Salipiger thiooxidans]SDF69315.1 phage major capsid protein, HK97 family [Salipiger thiooxidans]